MISRTTLVVLITALLVSSAYSQGSGPEWTQIAKADQVLMGDYQGKWLNTPTKGYLRSNPKVCAQVINTGIGKYRINLLPDHNRRAALIYSGEATLQGDTIVLEDGDWSIRVAESGLTGSGKVGGQEAKFSLSRLRLGSPTLGAKPPKGSLILFDGSNFDQWEHEDGRAVTWALLEDGAMEVNSRFKNKSSTPPIGGDIYTKQSFKDLRFHMEFRYPVEPEQQGQLRGNSGLFFQGYEVQILNSYGLDGLWNELGALYKLSPPKVNAARPPLEWQTYDIIYRAPRYDGNQLKENARITVSLNGIVVQRDEELIHQTANGQLGRNKPAPKEAMPIRLQDHINRIQFRNIWAEEL
ncbi:3-keto-disaccharide hydrolase [Pelagicoccus mobilis]|uniref:DUF1080 domain-containing protein n=1 Tax=Pelagicoccus mobilis TaxID=415221 RepID=A0A934RVX2_9BACT|nr:DUF1080 domain-containing protein [Pelagicoccus mobilis]MBK1877466.1 DUF1080 domain-containing protein [Pelagicoccus mobilis]